MLRVSLTFVLLCDAMPTSKRCFLQYAWLACLRKFDFEENQSRVTKFVSISKQTVNIDQYVYTLKNVKPQSSSLPEDVWNMNPEIFQLLQMLRIPE